MADVLRPGLDARDDFLVRFRSGQIHALQRGAQSEKVSVRIGESGNDRGPVQIDHHRRGSGQRSGFCIGADENNPAAANRERRYNRTRIIHRVDVTVGENEISRRLRSEHRWCERCCREVA